AEDPPDRAGPLTARVRVTTEEAMTSRLRVLGLHAVMLCTLVAAVLATHIAAIKPDLPLALLDSFDQAFDLVYDAAERKVSELEAAPTSPLPRRDIAAILRDLE